MASLRLALKLSLETYQLSSKPTQEASDLFAPKTEIEKERRKRKKEKKKKKEGSKSELSTPRVSGINSSTEVFGVDTADEELVTKKRQDLQPRSSKASMKQPQVSSSSFSSSSSPRATAIAMKPPIQSLSSASNKRKSTPVPPKAWKKRRCSAQIMNLPERERAPRRTASGLLTEDDDALHRERALTRLADLIANDGKRLLVITGAGLSCASGIPPFRRSKSSDGFGNEDAIWAQHVEETGTRATFLKGPLKWYEHFWLPNFAPAKMRKEPNPGHKALATLATLRGCAGGRDGVQFIGIVTQNVDGLQQAVRLEKDENSDFENAPDWDPEEHLIEAHGRVGLYKCSSDPCFEAVSSEEDGGERSASSSSCSSVCIYAEEQSLDPFQAFSAEVRAQLGHGPTRDAPPLDLERERHRKAMWNVPLCPHCASPCMPQALLFDEDYTDHAFYQFDKLQLWLKEAEVILFVGTSFAVTLTALAVTEARERRLPMFNFNIDPEPEKAEKPTLDWSDVCGRAEETLPRLVQLVRERLDSPPARISPPPSKVNHLRIGQENMLSHGTVAAGMVIAAVEGREKTFDSVKVKKNTNPNPEGDEIDEEATSENQNARGGAGKDTSTRESIADSTHRELNIERPSLILARVSQEREEEYKGRDVNAAIDSRQPGADSHVTTVICETRQSANN